MKDKRIWELQVPIPTRFAELQELYREPVGEKCSECNAYLDVERQPLLVEWDDGSDQVGDFVFAGGPIVIQDRVATEIRQIAGGFNTEPIEFFDHPNLRRPANVPDRKRPKRIWLPYDGPPLSQLVVTRKVPLTPESTVEIASKCGACGTIRYKRILGVEKKNSAVHTPRVPGQGLFIERDAIGEDGLFAPIGTLLHLCTSSVKEFIEQRGYTNIEFLEYGELI